MSSKFFYSAHLNHIFHCSGMSFKITANDYPEEISLSAINVDENIAVLSRGPYVEPNALYEVEKCVELVNYEFNLTEIIVFVVVLSIL